ncbi:type II toxin-antitoxin system VapC family toxin [Methylomagnum sp.]
MNYLLDTHLALWWEGKHPRLPEQVSELIQYQAETVYVSRASLWEMAIKISLGKLRMDLEKFIAQIEADGFEWLDIKNAHLLEVRSLLVFADHKDPFDRLLVAQSLTEPLILLTVDPALTRYGSTVRVF